MQSSQNSRDCDSGRKAQRMRSRIDRKLEYPTYSLTDCGNAERLVDMYLNTIRFCPQTRAWFVWDGHRWQANDGLIVQLAKNTVRTILKERKHVLKLAERYPENWEFLRPQADALHKWATHSEGDARIAAMIHLAKTDPRVSVKPEDFDTDPWLLDARNGTIDLRTGRLHPHSPERLITRNTGQRYEPDAHCDRWQIFLQQVFESRSTTIPFIQKAIGYTLTGETREECIFLLVGSGRNGKSTLLGALHQALGSYGGIAEIETFLVSSRSSLREDIADMQGKRFISAQEPALSGMFAENTLKWLSGGDRLRSRRLYEHAREFQPTHKLWLALNRLPNLRRDDPAVWSRLHVIPFDTSFRGREDRNLKHQLQSELGGILTWAVHGCLMWQQEGLGTSFSLPELPVRQVESVSAVA